MNPEVRELLSQHSAQVRETALALRELVLSLAPDATEKVHPGWREVGYRCGQGMKAQFCGIGLFQGRVNLYFHRGADLADPTGLLEGRGKRMRHVKIRSLAEVQNEALRPLIIAAAALARQGSAERGGT